MATELRIGAMTRHRELLESAAAGEHFAILHDAERVIADPIVRNRGTVGGSICQADPSEDLSAVFAALRAEAVIRSSSGERVVGDGRLPPGSLQHRGRPGRDARRGAGADPARVRQRLREGGAPGGRLGGGRRRAFLVMLDGDRVADAGIGLAAVGAEHFRAAAAEEALRGSAAGDEACGPGRRGSLPRAAIRSATSGGRRTTSGTSSRCSPCGRCAGPRPGRGERGHSRAGDDDRERRGGQRRESSRACCSSTSSATTSGLTGTHWGCDTSNCGVCVVWMDGEPVKSCTVLAAMAGGRTIRTVEDLEQGGVLDPVQEGFMEEHGLQCGFCTPGMMITARWLLDHNPDPTEAEIRETICGQICRCTGYENIVRAVRWAAEHPANAWRCRHDATDRAPNPIGFGRMKRKEDVRFIRGKGNYVDDLQLPGMLHGAILRSPIAHARIKSIDTSAAEAHPKVKAVITGKILETLGLAWIPALSHDVLAVLATDKVRFQGQEVAFVVAEDRYSARDALELIDVEYEPLPPVIDARRALDPGAPVIRDDIEGKADNHIFDWEAGRQGGDRRGVRRRPTSSWRRTSSTRGCTRRPWRRAVRSRTWTRSPAS